MRAMVIGPSLKARALRHLARRDHSRAELRRKLIDAGPRGADADALDASADADSRHEQAVDRLLDELAAAGWLSDARAAESLLAAKTASFGVRRLERMLEMRGIARETTDPLLRTARATEAERAIAVWRRRFGDPPADARDRARQLRFLLARGFAPEVARRVVGGDDE